MMLKVLDLRDNLLSLNFCLMFDKFLRKTVVLLWDNPFVIPKNFINVDKEYEYFIENDGKFHSYHDPIKIGVVSPYDDKTQSAIVALF